MNNKQLIQSFYDAFSTDQTDALSLILSPHWINHPEDKGMTPDVAGLSSAIHEWHQAFEQLHIQVEQIVEENAFVVARIQLTGKQVKDWAGYTATQQMVTFYGMDMHRIENERIAETWHFENYQGLLPK